MSYITGPCLIKRGGITIYTESGLKDSLKTKLGDVKSDLHGGKIDQYMISRMVTLSAKPVDAIANLAAYFGLGLADIGSSIFTAEIVPLSLASVAIAVGGSATVTTTEPHNLGPVGSALGVTLAGVAATVPSVNGAQVATITSETAFTIPVNVTTAATVNTGTCTPVSVPLQIVSKNEQAIYTYERSGILKAPGVHLGASKGFFAGDMQWAVLGSVTKQPTDEDYWRSAIAAAFADSVFDETKIRRYRYTAAYGNDAAFAAISAQGGFDIAIDYTTEEIPDDNVGVGDVILTALAASVKFTPSNLTTAQVDALVNLQGASALQPGDSVAGDGGKALVISGSDAATGFTATLNGVGFHDDELNYAAGKLRFGEVAGISKRTWTGGAPNSLFTFEITGND
ncbi:MAG: hypothetical protein PHQ12_04770 [Chthoniobacteraceae bacterium]|nr:hypothetical protein [Chthoniobacteraceae bacterium]